MSDAPLADFRPIVPAGVSVERGLALLTARRGAEAGEVSAAGEARPSPSARIAAQPGPGHNNPPSPTIGDNGGPPLFDWEMPPAPPGEVSEATLARGRGQAPAPRPPQAPQAPQDPQGLHVVTVNGQQHQVPLSELVAGYMRGADYTQKTQQLADQFKQAGEAHALFAKARDGLLQYLPQQINAALAQFNGIDWERLAAEDPIRYAQMDARYKVVQHQQHALREAQESLAREQEATNRHELATGHQLLSSLIPGWADDQVRPRIQAAIRQHVMRKGYTAADLVKPITDPRLMILAYDSMKLAAIEGRTVQQQLPRPPAGAPTGAGTVNRGSRPAAHMRGGPPASDAVAAFTARPSVDNALGLLAARRAPAARRF